MTAPLREALNRNAVNERTASLNNAMPAAGATIHAAPRARETLNRNESPKRSAGAGNTNPFQTPIVLDQRQPPVMLNRPVGAEVHQAQTNQQRSFSDFSRPPTPPKPPAVVLKPSSGQREALNRNAANERTASFANANPQPTPVIIDNRQPSPMFSHPIGLNPQPTATLPHTPLFHLPSNPPVLRPLPTYVAPQPVLVDRSPRHVTVYTGWSSIVAVALAILGIAVIAEIVAPPVGGALVLSVGLPLLILGIFVKAISHLSRA